MSFDELILVTGGSRGIGAATASLLVERGKKVVVADIAPDATEQSGTITWDESFDVSNEESVTRNIARIEEMHGPIGGLVNAAGVFGKMHAVDRIRMPNWDLEFDIDLRGTFLVAREVAVRMMQRRRGAIVNVASISGMTSAPIHAYSAAKAGVIQLTQTLAGSLGISGVRINAVSPGFTRTATLEAGINSGALDKDRLTRNSTMKRLVEPREVAFAIAWLLGPESSGVTGINLPVDAGFVAGATWDAYGGLPVD